MSAAPLQSRFGGGRAGGTGLLDGPCRAERITGSARPALLFFLMSAYVFLLPVQFENATLNLAPSDLMLGLALVFGLGRLRWVAGAWSPFHACLVLVFLVSAFVSISDFGTVLPYAQVKVAGLVTLLAAYLCLTSAATDWTEIRSLLRTFVLATTLNVVVALVAFGTGVTVPGLNYGAQRLSGMLIDPNAFGGLVMVALILQLVTQEGGAALVKGVPGMAVSGTLAVGLALTLSRSAWIGFAFALTLAAIFRWRLAAAWAVVVAIGAAGAWMSFENPDSLALIERPNTAMQRVDQIQQALPMFSSSPILGAGIGAFSQKVRDPETGGSLIIHNTTVWIMTEFGLVGLSMFLGFLLWFFAQGLAALKTSGADQRPLILALLSAHAGMIGVSTGIEALYQRHWWLCMALLAAGCAMVRREAAGGLSGRVQLAGVGKLAGLECRSFTVAVRPDTRVGGRAIL
jgi:putative inorganic carbon (HCO3(-)) transporter